MEIKMSIVPYGNSEYTKWVAAPCGVARLRKEIAPYEIGAVRVDSFELSTSNTTESLSLYIRLKDTRGIKEMNSFARTLLQVSEADLAKLAAVFEWDELHTHRCPMTWDRAETLAKGVSKFLVYPKARNFYDVGVAIAHERELLKGLPKEVVEHYPFEQLGIAYRGDGEFTSYGFVAHRAR